MMIDGLIDADCVVMHGRNCDGRQELDVTKFSRCNSRLAEGHSIFHCNSVNIMSPHCSRKRMRSELQRWRALMITKVHLADIWLMRPDGIGHPLAASTAPLGARGE